MQIFFNLLCIGYYIIREDINLIHAHRTYPAGYCAVIIGKLFNIPIVITAHGDDILIVSKINYGINLNKKLKKKSLYALRNADVIIALNEGMKSECISHGIHPQKINCIPLGINFDKLNNNISSGIKIKRGKISKADFDTSSFYQKL